VSGVQNDKQTSLATLARLIIVARALRPLIGSLALGRSQRCLSAAFADMPSPGWSYSFAILLAHATWVQAPAVQARRKSRATFSAMQCNANAAPVHGAGFQQRV